MLTVSARAVPRALGGAALFLSTCRDGWQREKSTRKSALAGLPGSAGVAGGREKYAARSLSSRPVLDLDALMSANKYGAATNKPSAKSDSSSLLDVLMSKNRYGGAAKAMEKESNAGQMVNYSPEYPYDIDVGPLFCTRANRCFLDGGNRCGDYQTGKRNKGMLEDLYRVCQDTGFFFMHNTFLTNKELDTPYNHMAAIYAEEEDRPGGLGIIAQVISTNLGFSRPGIDTERPGMIAKHTAFSVRKESPENHMPNRWPPEDFRGGLKEDTIKFYNEMDAISNKVAQALCDMMGLDPATLGSGVPCTRRTDKCMSGLQMMHFPPSANVFTDAQGLEIVKDSGWRTDPGLFMIISQTEPCYQVQDVQGNTSNLRCGQERFIVLLGDVVEVITNGHIKATKYRVVPRKGERAALEFAARLDPDAHVAPSEMFIEEGSPVYPSTTQRLLMTTKIDELSCYKV